MPREIVDLAINGRFLLQPTTGVQRVARELVREIDALVADGEAPFRVRLLHQRGAPVEALDLRAIAPVEVAGRSGHFWEQVSLPQAARGSWLLCLGNTAPLISLARGAGVAVMIHDLSYRLFPQAYRRTYRAAHSVAMPMLLRHANPIITVSESERRMLANLMPEASDRIVVAQNGGWRDSDLLSNPPTEETQRRYGLYVGSFSHRKNFDGILECAIRLAREDGIPFRFVGAAGSILAPPPIDLPSDVADKIEFLGQVEDLDRLAEIYSSALFLLFPSFYEASPLPPLEAMRFGCPVVASDIEAMRERCGPAAAYCDPLSITSILSAVRRVTRDKAYARRLVELGELCASRYSWRSQARTVLAAILHAVQHTR